MTKPPGSIRKAWYRWKMLQLPWRRQRLVGSDLQGNTYWEFKDALNSQRNRRIVQYSGWIHHGDVNVTPVWMQWLRHTRFEPPTIADQEAEVYRQDRIRQLAAQADARWAAKPSALDAPDKQQPVQMLASRDQSTGIKQTNVNEEILDKARHEHHVTESAQATGDDPEQKRTRKESANSPWKHATKGNPGDEWQPQTWSPGAARRRAS